MIPWLLGVFAGCVLLGVPISFALILACFAAIAFASPMPLAAVVQGMVAGVDSTPLIAIPLFVLFGEVMARGGLGMRIVLLGQACVGWIRGGLAHANVVASMFFGGISGAATADTAAIGSVAIPAMRRVGYPAGFSAAVTAASSIIGIIIPPSIDLILYGWLTSTPIDQLFAGGFIPGVLVGVSLMVVSWWLSVRGGFGERKPFQISALVGAMGETWPILLLPPLVLGGILGGWFTVTEAAAVAIVYGFCVSVLWYRDLRLGDVPSVLRATAATLGSVMLLLAAARMFGWILTVEQVPQALSAWLQTALPGPDLFLLNVIFICLLAGLFLTPASATIILTPILFPSSQAFGLDPVHFGMVLNVALALGHITPPVGLTLLIAGNIAGVRPERMAREILPFLLVLIAATCAVAWIPELTLALPRLMRD